MSSTDSPSVPARHALWCIIALVLMGCGARLTQWESVERLYFDESYYTTYATFHSKHSLAAFPGFCDAFIKMQETEKFGMPPPTRLLYPFLGAIVHNVFGISIPRSLILLSALASCAMLVIGGIWARRMFGGRLAVGITLLMAVSLNQLHLSQRLMIDPIIGVFCMAALWSLWELGNGSGRKCIFACIYAASLFALVFVKESSFVVFVGIAASVVIGRRCKTLPVLPPYILIVTVASGALAFSILCLLVGGFGKFFQLYRTLVERSLATPYVHIFGDGPWFRYIVDSMLAQPLPTVLALAALFWLPFKDAKARYLTLFVLVTFALMASIKYGVFYRYAIIWDFPIAVLATLQLAQLSERLSQARAHFIYALALVLIGALQMQSFWRIGVEAKGYALTSYDMVTALRFYVPPLHSIQSRADELTPHSRRERGNSTDQTPIDKVMFR